MNDYPAYIVWLVICVGLGISASIWIRNKRDSRRKKEGEEYSPSVEMARAHRRIADQAMTDLIGIAQDAAAQIDTKIRLLNHLVKEANVCIERLEKLNGLTKEKIEQGGIEAGKGSEEAADRDKEMGDALGAPLGKAASEEKDWRNDPEALEKAAHTVSDLSKEGLTAEDIAKKTGLSSMEIDLLSALSEK